jgi:hypothetical protein
MALISSGLGDGDWPNVEKGRSRSAAASAQGILGVMGGEMET